MNALIQDVLVTALALAALGWLVARGIRRRQRPGCEDCPASRAEPANAGDFVALEELTGAPPKRPR